MNLILVTEEMFALCLSVQPRAISIDAKKIFPALKQRTMTLSICIFLVMWLYFIYYLFMGRHGCGTKHKLAHQGFNQRSVQ